MKTFLNSYNQFILSIADLNFNMSYKSNYIRCKYLCARKNNKVKHSCRQAGTKDHENDIGQLSDHFQMKGGYMLLTLFDSRYRNFITLRINSISMLGHFLTWLNS